MNATKDHDPQEDSIFQGLEKNRMMFLDTWYIFNSTLPKTRLGWLWVALLFGAHLYMAFAGAFFCESKVGVKRSHCTLIPWIP